MRRILFLFAILMAASASAQEITSGVSYVQTYEQAMEIENKKVLVIFGADWCLYCQKLKGDLDLLNLDDYVVCMVDADERADLKGKHSFKMLPSSLILLNRKEISRKSGYTKQDYMGWLKKNK
jgi:thioredoxin-related protein